ncbi:hypothetical protein ACFU8W_26845 [Streptomyces sp. NPDC057565]|uniref:hypothetical protein n=1 Tax=Streptomyces sp. NPDC057565 TaxID=3346169 RepID=UPI0036C3032A
MCHAAGQRLRFVSDDLPAYVWAAGSLVGTVLVSFFLVDIARSGAAADDVRAGERGAVRTG